MGNVELLVRLHVTRNNEENESHLGRLAARGEITTSQFEAGKSWRALYFDNLHLIGGPYPFPNALDPGCAVYSVGQSECRWTDEQCEEIAQKYRRGCSVLIAMGKRVFHSVNALVVFEEPEELGDFASTVCAAKIGLDALAREF